MTIVHPRNPRSGHQCAASSPTRSPTATPLSGPRLVKPSHRCDDAHPGDLSIAIAIAFEALTSPDLKRTEVSLDQLAKLVDKTPLDPLAQGVQSQLSRERAQAASQVPLWLVARACRAHQSPAVRIHADRFAKRALEAARRQDDRQWLLALMREQGQIAFDQSDRASASAVWSRMLDLVVTPPQAKSRRPPAAAPGAGRPPAAGPSQAAGVPKAPAPEE